MLIAELDALQPSILTLEASYLWGLDLSGSLQGADGVGGLSAVTDGKTGSTSYPEAKKGHARLDTTEIYTEVSIHHPCEVYEKTHPNAQTKGT